MYTGDTDGLITRGWVQCEMGNHCVKQYSVQCECFSKYCETSPVVSFVIHMINFKDRFHNRSN